MKSHHKTKNQSHRPNNNSNSNSNTNSNNKRHRSIDGEPTLNGPKHTRSYRDWTKVKLDAFLRQRIGNVIDNMIKADDWMLWFAPVDTSMYTDYLLIIRNPMDYATLKSNVTLRNQYDTLKDVYKTFVLIYENTYLYNPRDGPRANIYDKAIQTEILFQFCFVLFIFILLNLVFHALITCLFVWLLSCLLVLSHLITANIGIDFLNNMSKGTIIFKVLHR